MLSYINEQGVEVMLDAKNAEITRKINGDYTLSFMAIDEPDLVEELIVVCEGQNYRIKQLSSMMSGNKTIQSATCKHISNDLIDYYAYDYLTNTVTLNKALQFLFEGTPFTYSISGSVSNKSFEKLGEMNKQKLLAKIIDTYGLEYEVDNYHFAFKKTVGYETEFQFRYKANISNVKKDIDTTSLTTYIKGYGKQDDEGNYLCTAEYTSPNAEKFGVRHADPVFDERFTIQSELLEYIKTKLNDTPDIVVELDYTQIDASQPINLGDYGYLIHEPLQLDLLSRVIEITKKLSTDRQGNNYQNMTYKIGSQKLVKSSFETNKDSITGDLNIPDVDYDKIQAEIDKGKQEATDMINAGLGGYVTKTRNELLIMDTEDTATARNLWRWNINGLGFSSNGYSGPYATAITSNGKINADRILVGTIDGALIRANTIQTNSLEISTVQKINSAITADDATAIMNTHLEVYDGNIKAHINTVTESKIEGVNNSISALAGRVNSAESKITDEAITNTVKQNFYTKEETENAITSKGYATQSQVQQTADNLQIKFTESGGYNLLKNGKAALNTNFWASNGGGIARNTDSVYKTCFKTSLPSGIKYNGGDSGGAIRLKNNTHYVFEAMIYSKTTISGSSVKPLHFWCNTTATTSGQGQCTIIDYKQDVPSIKTWTKCYVHFLTKPSGEVWFTPFVYVGGDLTGDIWVTELSLSESSIQMPYSPHPSEIYDGITTIDKDGINVSTSYGAHTQFHSGGMSSYNNSNQRTLGIENGGISFHAWNNNALAAYVTQSSLWGGDQSASGLAISTTKNGAYLALGTSSLSDVNTTLNMDQALTISANDSFQPRGINFWKDVHAHGYGIRQLSHLKLAGSGAIQFDYLNNSPSTIYEAVDSGHSLYVMGGYQLHLGCMEGSGTPHGVIWMRGKTDTHSYTHWDFHNYTMYNMKTASTYANYNTRRIGESYGVTSNVDGVRYLYKNVELVNGKAIRSIPLEYKGCEYDIVSIVCKGRGSAWVETEDENRFEINGDCKSVNIEIIIYSSEDVMTASTQQLEEAPTLELPKKIEPEEALLITNEAI